MNAYRGTICIISLILLALLISPSLTPVAADTGLTFTVNASNDVVDANPGNGVCDTEFGSCTLRAAIMEANAHIGSDTIILPSATYLLHIPGADEDLAATGDLDITESLAIQGDAKNLPTIDAESLGDRIFQITGSADQVSMSDFLVKNGFVSGSGGAINSLGHLIVNNLHFVSNQATFSGGSIATIGYLDISDSEIQGSIAGSSGGGIYISGSLNIRNSRFSGNNSAIDGGGLAVTPHSYVKIENAEFGVNYAGEKGGDISNYGDLVINGREINNGHAGLEGGGIYNGEGSDISLSNVSFNYNSAPSGGAISNGGIISGHHLLFDDNSADNEGGAINNNTGEINLDRVIFSHNSSSAGGAIETYLGNFTLKDSSVISNTASLDGGGLRSVSKTILDGVLLKGNSAQNGGGISNDSALEIQNCTISGNSASQNGGGIFNASSIKIYSSTITANLARAALLGSGMGGGIFDDIQGAVDVSNTILSGNHHMQIFNKVDDDCSGNLHTGNYNLIGTLSGCNLIGSEDLDLIGEDPKLNELSNNGGPTLTHALGDGSPAIDAGNPAGCMDYLNNALLTDQRGYLRSWDGDGDGTARCDIGAYEYASRLQYFLPITQK